jgi:apolipoprotein N-acyltransferase
MLIMVSFFVLPGLALLIIFWIFSAKSVGQKFVRLVSVITICALVFWLGFGLLLGLALQRDAKEQQPSGGDTYLGI